MGERTEEWFWSGVFPREPALEMGELDLLGVNFSEYGLPGFSSVASDIINREFERGDSGIRSLMMAYPNRVHGTRKGKKTE